MSFVTFIGSGNLAWHLAPALDNTDYGVREVYSRNPKHASELVSKLYEAEVKDSLDFTESKSRIFIIATSDDAIESVIHRILLPEDSILVHISGSQPLNILSGTATENIGVFYPLQTFSKKKKIDFKEVPFFIESENKNTERVLMAMAKSISNKVRKITSAERTALHVAAVFASNFTNHMLTIARQVMKENKLDYEWLKPLIAETITKSLDIGPELAQTGPARRGDLEILDRQLDFLKEDEQITEIYKLISQHILDRYES
jgi:predicted short-subunit dehydrogenase-like oxidoreductase (DUF2520 family)